MIVGIPKEIKNNENRVSLTPAGAHELVQRGHTLFAFLFATILKIEHEKEYFTCSLFFDAVGNHGAE